MRGIGYIVVFLWVWIGCLACSDREFQPDGMKLPEDEVMVRLVVSTPRATVYANDSEMTVAETEIQEIQVLVFEDGSYQYRAPGISISNAGTTASFSVRLPASSKSLDLYIVANATAAVVGNDPLVGQGIAEVRTNLQSVFPENGYASVLPMAGMYRLPAGLVANQPPVITGVKMLRAIARVDVLAGTTVGFELNSIQAFRANTRIQLIPATVPVTGPEVPGNSQAVVETEAVLLNATDTVARIYLPESAAPEADNRILGATCIVVGGKLAGEANVTYYRIDFDPDNKQNSFGQILRNHCYIFKIRSVAGAGWPTAEEAANNRSAQINLDIQDWDQTTEDMYFDTEHYFGVSSREALLRNKMNSVDTINIGTDLSTYTLQWSDQYGNVSGDPAESLSDSYFKVEKIRQGKQLLITALQNNSGNTADRLGYFVITASRWRVLMTIRQQYEGVANKVISMLSFRNGLGELGVNLILPVVTADARGAGLRGILDNLSNFGPTGTVACTGFNLLESNASPKTLTDAGLAAFDVIYFNYTSTSAFADQDIQKIIHWLDSDEQRVMLVSYDGSGINVSLLTALLGTTQNITWFGSNTGPFPLVGKSATNFFTNTGPFTVSPYTPVADGFTFQNYDAYHGEINSGSAAGITPILNGPGGGIVLGVNYSRRVIYMGDVDLFTYLSGTGGNTNNHINNNTGNINNDASKLIANLFAWVVDIVSGE